MIDWLLTFRFQTTPSFMRRRNQVRYRRRQEGADPVGLLHADSVPQPAHKGRRDSRQSEVVTIKQPTDEADVPRRHLDGVDQDLSKKKDLMRVA